MTFNPKDHVMNMRGKDYLEVKWRLVWFREEHPAGRIETEVVTHDPVLMKALVFSADNLLATGYGTAKVQGVAKSRPYEGAETAAIGRALAHAGFGTQFTGEDEGENLADSPVERPQQKELHKVTKSGNGSDPSLNPKYLVDNELSSNIAHAGKILNGLHLGGKPASDDNMKLIAKYRELKDGGMDDEHAFAGALS